MVYIEDRIRQPEVRLPKHQVKFVFILNTLMNILISGSAFVLELFKSTSRESTHNRTGKIEVLKNSLARKCKLSGTTRPKPEVKLWIDSLHVDKIDR